MYLKYIVFQRNELYYRISTFNLYGHANVVMPVNPSKSNSSVSDTLQNRNFWTRFEKTRNISVLAKDSPGHILGPKRRKE